MYQKCAKTHIRELLLQKNSLRLYPGVLLSKGKRKWKGKGETVVGKGREGREGGEILRPYLLFLLQAATGINVMNILQPN